MGKYAIRVGLRISTCKTHSNLWPETLPVSSELDSYKHSRALLVLRRCGNKSPLLTELHFLELMSVFRMPRQTLLPHDSW